MATKVQKISDSTFLISEDGLPKFFIPVLGVEFRFDGDNIAIAKNGTEGSYTSYMPLSSFEDTEGDPFATIQDFINSIANPQIMNVTGYGFYADNQYSESNPFLLAANTLTTLPNNAATKNEANLPSEVNTFFDGAKLTPKNVGDTIDLNISLNVKTSSNNSWVRLAVDIGGSIGLIFPQAFTLPRGIDEEQPVTFVVNGFCGSTFVPNGGIIKIISNNALEVYDISYVVSRFHKSKTHNGTIPK